MVLNWLEENDSLKLDHTLSQSVSRLINDWQASIFPIEERLIITVRNKEVDVLNKIIRRLLKANGVLTDKEYKITSFNVKLSQKIFENYINR